MLREKLFKDFLKSKKNLEMSNQLIDLHLPLVKKLVSKFKYYPCVLQKDDLYQEGVLGLIKALDNYVDLGYDFIAYATPTIKSEIRELIRKSHSPSVPQKIHKTNNPSFQEEKHTWHYQILNPHQLWLKQIHHELFLKKLKTKLSKKEFNVIRLNFGVPLGNINEDYQPSYSNHEISQILNLTLRQVENIKNIAINKLKK
ncbi:MAG: sigma-70 family RNA polymerase sigma factor [Candidatus Phytoplasma asteris]|uniref:DNA-directed RNA polymerase specialized sigma n=1 Tax='Chrysanthemum coronarium' phytoplasma TaxID=1520703 RepID=A0ABQ0J2W0_9MOLU|nr:sigma-70 family RNA polymerase sigma factor ['Chrysanthemum coronarium' phytoplasma]TKA87977.1 MAG: DNA-directed RNA polymerase sigma-70 factor [Periwinkle leaf yellowing phytoplasma]WEX19473.1 MAG: sigma-70 family RNA polymerase sigma factor [Candidatus Phytoplasma asteris]GAK73940.1 DNA-directed RNA polymerase specialized sigma ['Chrysanthemum coronarium' phytoplasma]